MKVEIERKYLLRELPDFPKPMTTLDIDQGYLPGVNLIERLRRQRNEKGDVQHFRTVKLGSGIERLELEDETDEALFQYLWELTKGRRVKKVRYRVPHGDDIWEIDKFTDRQLVLAEIELDRADRKIDMPEWLTRVLVREVTNEPQYTNRALAR